eukprot:TRINITY_DN5250_c0_g1_i1.p1 TRINITY_DN5250_c0_g1~~TRINITY_DN5250_c0_g1_i1.p1  ORF type:complete len:701 (-),score=186.50 TRINITY_DN5250_c0_g1_i1:348-2450(-)
MSKGMLLRSPSMARQDSQGRLSRAGWHIMSAAQLAAPPQPPLDLEAEGYRLIADLAKQWCGKYSHYIRQRGAHGGAFHYECVFSRPTNEVPVPTTIVHLRFALLVPQADQMPHLLFSFEEGDLRHSWQLDRDGSGKLQVAKGQQAASLRHGYFETYLDKYIFEKETAQKRGINMVTPFEQTRLKKPPAGEDAIQSRQVSKSSQQAASTEVIFARQSSTTSRRQMTAFARQSSSSDGVGGMPGDRTLAGLKRKACRDCINAMLGRISPQEAHRLMQTLPEDEHGFVQIEDILARLEELRTGALLNCLVESDVESLRTHLVMRFRSVGLTENGTLKLWQLKAALLQADQVCLSRLQMHALLSNAYSALDSETGEVDVQAYLGMLCVVIPHMFDAQIFSATAERLQLEAAEMQRMKENAELAALASSKMTAGQEEKEQSQVIEVDQDTVERNLIQAFTLAGSAALPPEAIYAMMKSNDQQVISCQLNEYEITGFVAEIVLDSKGEVPYVDLVKRSVPLIFEVRRSTLIAEYVAYDDKEGGSPLQIPKPDLVALEALVPLVPAGWKSEEPDIRKSTKRRASRRTSRQDLDSQDMDISRSKSKSMVTLARGRPTLAAGGPRFGTRRGSQANAEDAIFRDPPPGRGYERRVARLAEVWRDEQAAFCAQRSQSKATAGSAKSPASKSPMGERSRSKAMPDLLPKADE